MQGQGWTLNQVQGDACAALTISSLYAQMNPCRALPRPAAQRPTRTARWPLPVPCPRIKGDRARGFVPQNEESSSLFGKRRGGRLLHVIVGPDAPESGGIFGSREAGLEV